MSRASDTRLATGQQILVPKCLVVTQIGEDRYVHLLLSKLTPPFESPSSLGLAVNFLLIESLQRFYQYYGDDLKVSFTALPPASVINHLDAV